MPAVGIPLTVGLGFGSTLGGLGSFLGVERIILVIVDKGLASATEGIESKTTPTPRVNVHKNCFPIADKILFFITTGVYEFIIRSARKKIHSSKNCK